LGEEWMGNGGDAYGAEIGNKEIGENAYGRKGGG